MTDKQIIIDEFNASEYAKTAFELAKETLAEKDQLREYYDKLLQRKEQECEKAKQNAQDTYDLWQALIESFNILQDEKIKLEQECEELKKQLESTKGLVTVGNRQLMEALEELQIYKDKEQKEKEENEKLYKKLEGSCLIGKHWKFK